MTILGMSFDEYVVGAPFTHDSALVIVSFLVAALSSYTALELAERLRRARRRGGVWHSASAIALGGGMWSMHFIAMLAFNSPQERGYDLGLTALSAVVAIAVVALGFWIVRAGAGWPRVLSAGAVVGAGVVAMHYTGMAALHVEGEIFYRPSLFLLSVAIALAAATAALWLAFSLTQSWQRVIAAVVMAAAICGMHYTAMAATVIVPGLVSTADTLTVPKPMLAAAIVLGVVGIVLIGLVAAFYDRRRELDAIQEAVRLREQVARRTADLQIAADQLDQALIDAERASAAKSDFLASMSHELRTPLNSILGFSQLLLASKSFEPLSPTQAGAVQQIDQAGRHLLLLIDDILDLSRIEAGRVQLSIETVEVAPLIEEVTAMLQPAATEAGVALHTDAAFPDLFVRADRRRLQQVLINLVTNGIKYNHRGGNVNVSCREADGAARIAVSDTGVGIPAQYMDELFEPFNRLGQEQSAVVGSGVGLALCRSLIEAMLGTIRADSVEGDGSTFTLTLPLANHAPWKALSGQTRATVLYVEDNPANISLMRHIMKELGGVELVVSTNPREGIELARGLRPALIVLDINLPEMDGFTVLGALRDDPDLAATPIFAVTANAMPREVERGIAAGFDRYLTKPLNVAHFVNAVEAVLRSPAPARASRAAALRTVRAAPLTAVSAVPLRHVQF